MKLSRSEAAQHLGISLSTFDRYVKAGKITVEYGPENRLGKRTVWVDFPEITEPCSNFEQPSAANSATDERSPESGERSSSRFEEPCSKFEQREPSNVDERIASDLAFADLYRAGLVTDSSGNTINGTNAKFPNKGIQSLLGPVERTEPKISRTGTAHMDPALLSDHVGPLSNPVRNPQESASGFTRSGSPLAAGLSREQYDAMMRDWRRSGGGRSESEMERAQRNTLRAINEAFPKAE